MINDKKKKKKMPEKKGEKKRLTKDNMSFCVLCRREPLLWFTLLEAGEDYSCSQTWLSSDLFLLLQTRLEYSDPVCICKWHHSPPAPHTHTHTTRWLIRCFWHTYNSWLCRVFREIWGVMFLSVCNGQAVLHFSCFNSSTESRSILLKSIAVLIYN